MVRIIVGVVAAALVGLALVRMAAETRGLAVTEATVGTTPVTTFAPAGSGTAPAVVIAHGFAGSERLMAPFATTLARSGYIAVTYDALGHGTNPAPLAGDVTAENGATAELERVVAFARDHPRGDGRVALVGHSMASDIVVRAALADPRIAATVAVSMFSPAVTATSPGNLLVIVGAWEAGLTDEALRVTALAAGEAAEPGTTYGSLADGTARRAVFAPRVEHVGVLYSPTSLTAARDWLNAAFGRDGQGAPDRRGGWILVHFAGALALAWACAPLLPRGAGPAPAGPLGRRGFAAAAILPALAAPLVALALPLRPIPVPVADYLVLHFGAYGLLTGLVLALVGGLARAGAWTPGRLALAATAVAGFGLLAFHLPVDRFVTAFVPPGFRLPLLAALLAGLLPYFLADEWLTRRPGAPALAYLATKAAFLVSLGIAVALDLERLFFLLIILPVILAFFAIFGLISRWSAAATGSPLPAALANAVLFAWAIAVTFPVLAA